MVDAIRPITGSSATSPTQVDRSLSITSEPDNKWVATRQSIIDSDQVALKQANAELQADMARYAGAADDEMEVSPDHHSHGGSDAEREGLGVADKDDQEKLSGESDLIGTVDFDDDTPFGHRTAIV
ncbi:MULTISPECIES: hypothetical protein [unclassified Rhizobium]